MDNDKLIVDKNVIFFKEIVSIDKYSIGPNYRIKYYKDNEIKSFIFLPKFTLPFFTPTFIKEIKKGMKNQ